MLNIYISSRWTLADAPDKVIRLDTKVVEELLLCLVLTVSRPPVALLPI